jgi:hypothetical protein
MLVAHCVWRNFLWDGLRGVRIVDDTLQEQHVETLVKEYGFAAPTGPVHSGRPAFVCDPQAVVAFIFCPQGWGVATFAHELGHAICDKLYPQSRGWEAEQLEAFALLADVNAQRWRTLEPSERESFSQHYRACRNSPGYERALRWAFSLRKLPLKEQMDAVANG